MSQHDFNIANQGFPATRADINNAFQAIASNSSGPTAPSTTFANMWWYDTTNNKMYLRNEADTAWIEVAVIDQTNSEWQLTTGAIQAKDADGILLKTDDGTARLTIADDGDATFTNDVDIGGELTADSYNETYAAVTSSSNATTVNCHNGNSFSHTLTENTTFTFSNPPASGTAYAFSIEIIQDSSASGYTVTWPSSVDFPAATAPTLTATASAVDVFVFSTRDGGTTWYGFTAGQAIATPA